MAMDLLRILSIKTIKKLFFWKITASLQAVNAQTHINVRYLFITYRIHKGVMSVEWCPTVEMTGNFLINKIKDLFSQYLETSTWEL